MRIAWHLGCGDAIVCTPIIAKLAHDNPTETIEVPSWRHNLVSVKDIFSEIKNVKVYAISDAKELSGADYNLGIYNTKIPVEDNENFISWFYRQAGMSQSERWFWCPIQKREYEDSLSPAITFIHDKPEHKINIEEDEFCIRPYGDEKQSVLRLIPILKNAKEIHCIDSAFLHLVEAIRTTGKLFFHKYARNGGEMSNFKLRKDWEVLV